MSEREWKGFVARVCSDTWSLGPYVTGKVIQGLDVLVATDQVSDFTVAEVLCRVGVDGSDADRAAPLIRARIRR